MLIFKAFYRYRLGMFIIIRNISNFVGLPHVVNSKSGNKCPRLVTF